LEISLHYAMAFVFCIAATPLFIWEILYEKTVKPEGIRTTLKLLTHGKIPKPTFLLFEYKILI